MSYTPIGWQTGDTITAEKLNKMDNGWSVTSETTTLCDETITTVDDGGVYDGQLSVSSVTASNIIVTYDGTTYQCVRDSNSGYGDDGNYTFADYPFRIESDGFIITETGGSHTVKVEAVESNADTSSAFAAAVSSVLPFLLVVPQVTTWQQAHDAISAGKIVHWYYDNGDGTASSYIATSTGYNSEQDIYEVYFNQGTYSMYADSPSGVLYPN